VFVLSLITTSCERYATEVRNLQRSEIGEAMEAFDAKKQVGSSTMAQKKNPVTSENVVGLARIVRGFLTPALEDMTLWHERDLTNSSAERFILPHVLVLTDDILVKMEGVFAHLVVRPEKMKENLERSKGLIMSEAVMIALVGKGVGRQDAHAIVRKASLEAEAKGIHLRDKLKTVPEVKKVMSAKEIDAAVDPANYVGKAPETVDAVVRSARAKVRAKRSGK